MSINLPIIVVWLITICLLGCRGSVAITLDPESGNNISTVEKMPGCSAPLVGQGSLFGGSYNTTGIANDAVVSGSYLYVADGISGIQILNISNPNSPTLVTTIDTPGEATRLVLNGNYLYVADGTSQRVVVINVSNPAAPTIANNLMHLTATAIYGIFIQGNYLYAVSGNGSSGSSRLFIWYIANPTNGVAMGVYTTNSTTTSVFVSGSYAYLAETTGLRIVDIANPNAPTSVGFLNTGASILDVAISGSYAYLAHHSLGVSVVSIANPANPTLVGSLATPGNSLQIETSGNKIYVASEAGFHMLSISASQTLTLEYNLLTAEAIRGVYLNGSQMVLSAGSEGIKIAYTFSLPPVVTNSVSPGSYWGPLYITLNQDDSGDIYYTTNGSDPMICALKYSTNIVLKGNSNLRFFSVKAGGTASTIKSFVYSVQVPVASISPPAAHFTSPITLNLSSTGPNSSVEYRYTINGAPPDYSSPSASSNPLVLNISGAGSLVFKFFSIAGGHPSDVVTAHYTYDIPIAPVATPPNGIFVGPRSVGLTSQDGLALHYTLDGTEPTTASATYAAPFNFNAPGIKRLRFLAGDGSSFSATSEGRYMILPAGSGYKYWSDTGITSGTVSGNYAYLAGCDKFVVVDISNASNPITKGSTTFGMGECGYAVELDSSNSVAFVKVGVHLHAYDISQPANAPVFLGNLSLASSGQMKHLGNFLYIAGAGGFVTINTANPSAMTVASTNSITGHALALAISGNYLYVTDGDGALRVYSISNPAVPSLVSQSSLNSTQVGMYMDISGNNLAVAAGSVLFYDISSPSAPVVRGSYPAEATRIQYSGNTIFAIGSGQGYGGNPPGNTGSMLYIIDATNISAPILSNEMNLAGRPAMVRRAGSITYVGVHTLGVFPGEYGGALYNINTP